MDKLKSFLHFIRPAFCVSLLLMLLCGLAFPLALNGLSALFFPYQAQGSPVSCGGRVVGMEHVGQEFTEPYFMKCRPSAVHYNTYTVNEAGQELYLDGSEFGGLASGSANYGPSNPALIRRVAQDMESLLSEHPELRPEDIPTDMLTASGSGLDPHISPRSAALQLPYIAEASGLSIEELQEIVEANTSGALLGVIGEDCVNVLGVNIAIAQAMGLKLD